MNDTTTFSGSASNGRSADASRRLQLIEVTLASLAEVGAQGTTLAHIAGKAGVSAGLVAHYFTDKEGLLEAAFRVLLAKHRDQLRWRLTAANEPGDRLKACVAACLSPDGLRASDSRAWLAFWSLVHQSAPLARIQQVYQRRMLSSLRAALRPLVPAPELAERAASIAALLEGTWLQAALAGAASSDSSALCERVLRHVTASLGERLPPSGTQPPRAPSREVAGGAEPERMPSYNPATGEVLAWVPVAGPLQIDEAVARARTEARPLMLVAFDLDHFKRINDRHGHLAGDAVLRAVSEAACAVPAPVPRTIGRLGGEEFAILLDGATEAQAPRVAGVSVSRVWKWELVDPAQVPLEFWSIDPAKLDAAVKAGTREIPGVRVYEDARVIARS